MNIGMRIRELRTLREWSLADLAAKTGLSKSFLWKLETRPSTNPSVKTIARLADALGATAAYLVDGSSSPSIPHSLADAMKLYDISEVDASDLANVRYRGLQPTCAADWAYLYLVLLTVVSGKPEDGQCDSD